MKTMIMIPCMDMVHTAFMHSLLLLDKPHDVLYAINKGTLIYDSRNQLLKTAIDSKVDRLLWLDSDMEIPMDAMRLLSEDIDSGKDIVSGLYFKRKPPYTPTIFKDCCVIQPTPNQLLPLASAYEDYPENSVFEIEACGFGCVMMTMDAVEKVIKGLGPMPFMPTAGFGEDLSFCMRAKHVGLKLWCDSRVRCGHVGYKTYTDQDYRGGNNGYSRTS